MNESESRTPEDTKTSADSPASGHSLDPRTPRDAAGPQTAENAAGQQATTKGANSPAPEGSADTPRRRKFRTATGNMRLIAFIPAVGFFICSLVLAIATFIDVIAETALYIQGGEDLHELATAYIQQADIFLLAIVLEILSLGIVSLFITDKLHLPRWLTFNDLDDLKERLVSVICVMLGVYFLGYVLEGARGLDVVWMGLGCSIVIVALAVFVRKVFIRKDGESGR